jgi:translocation protein SEC66
MDNTTSNSTFNTTFYDSSNGTWNSTSSTFTAPIPKPFWTGLLLPIAYLIILIGSLYSFSSVYRQRQLARASKLEPWFPNHVTRNIYLSLLHLDPAEGGDGDEKALSNEKGQSKVPDSVLKAALLKRAVEDIQRIVQLRQAKPALQTLLQRGSVGDELWQRFQRAEQEMEVEVKDVVEEVSSVQHTIHQKTPPIPKSHPKIPQITNISRSAQGQRLHPQLGPSNLPIRQRNQPKHPPQAAHNRNASRARRR